MLSKTVLVMLVLAVAAAEGRARGSKLGHLNSRQSIWGGRPRQEGAGGYPQTPSSVGTFPPTPQGANPGTFTPPSAVTQPQGGFPTLAPSPVALGGYNNQQAGQVPIVASGLSPVPPSACKYPGFFPTPGSCINFYRCVDFSGRGLFFSVFQFNCPLGTIFDDDLDICNHIAWTVPKRPECADMLHSSLVPLGSGPPALGSGPGVYPQPGPSTFPEPAPGVFQPQPGAGVPSQTVQPGSAYPQPAPGSGPSSAPGALPKPFSLQCYGDDTYRRHPLYCNRYYTCVFDGSDWTLPTLSCPEGLAFKETTQQCVEPAQAPQCDGQLAPSPTPEPITTELPTEAPATDTPTGQQGPAVDPSSKYDCLETGYFPFEGDCIRFYKCVELDSGALKGLLYKCPDLYGYSEEKKRCDKLERLPTCDKAPSQAVLRQAPATQLYPDDLLWFFNN